LIEYRGDVTGARLPQRGATGGKKKKSETGEGGRKGKRILAKGKTPAAVTEWRLLLCEGAGVTERVLILKKIR